MSFLLISIHLYSDHVSAQLPEDALRLSWTAPSGTARQQAIGGAMGSLGGEISAGFVNPAGLGMYKTSEFVMSPGFGFQHSKAGYLGSPSTGNSVGNFNLGTTGFVFATGGNDGNDGNDGHNGNSMAFSVAVNRTANFNGDTFYKGQNNYSSSSEQYVEEFAASGLTINQALVSPTLSYGTRMAVYTSLIDTATVGGSLQVISNANKAALLNQENSVRTSGGVNEIALALAGSLQDKWYFGGTLGIPIMNYTRTLSFTESDATGNTNNDFNSFVYNETYSSKAVGFNLKLGMIFKPTNALRLGVAIHTPPYFGVKDHISASTTTQTENYTSLPQVSIDSKTLDQQSRIDVSEVRYTLTTPWRFLVSGSYLIGSNVQYVRKQKGFLTADIGYTGNQSSFFHPWDATQENSYFDAVNGVIKSYYKGVIDCKLGGELKFNTMMVRAGLAYYTSPYSDNSLKADRLFASAGLGYRNKGFFVDLTYVQGFTRDVNFPYRLSDKSNSFATLKQTSGTVLMTFGIKF